MRIKSIRAVTGIVLLMAATVMAGVSTAWSQGATSYTPGGDVRAYTNATVLQWLQKYADAKPAFKPGDVLTAKDLEQMRPFVPPGYLEQLNFPEFRMKIIAPVDRTPRKDYTECSEKYAGQVRLKPDGTLDNYVCGRPFAVSELKPGDPLAGMKAAWDFEYRWQNYGVMGFNLIWIWNRPGGTHESTAPKSIEFPPSAWLDPTPFNITAPSINPASYYGGGGSFQRSLGAMHQRVYFSHLAPLSNRGGVLPIPGAEDFEFKEYTGFFSPFDISGTVFIIYRYNDPYRSDDAWAYLPTIRRVRRISAEVRSDSLLGTDITLDDFYSFAGREVEWNFKFLGWKDVIDLNVSHDIAHFYGPNGTIPDDTWVMRRQLVVERTPKLPRYPYSSVIMFWDPEDFQCSYTLIFDPATKLWKTFLVGWKWSEDSKDYPQINRGVRARAFQQTVFTDLQNGRATILSGTGFGYPDADPQHVAELYDVNKLEEIHR